MYKIHNKDLNAKVNKIKVVPAADPKPPGRRGRPKGQKPTINKSPEPDIIEDVDCHKCPDCGNPELADSYTEYPRTVIRRKTITKVYKYNIRRRYCAKCKKYVHAQPPNVSSHARVCNEQFAEAAALNMYGQSYAKTAKFLDDTSSMTVSSSWVYRAKIKTAKKLEPEYLNIAKGILLEPYLQCDEYRCRVPKKPGDGPGLMNGSALVALGSKSCLVRVAYDRTIPTLKDFLPGYEGVIGQDSYTGWRSIGTYRQMCLIHQIRIPKRDLKYNNPKGDVKLFLERLTGILTQIINADKIEDPHTRQVAARCYGGELRNLFKYTYLKDDEACSIGRYRKRYDREGGDMFTFLMRDGIDSNNNAVERVNRIFVPSQSNGGGNRSPRGMWASSILNTHAATCSVRNISFLVFIRESLDSEYG